MKIVRVSFLADDDEPVSAARFGPVSGKGFTYMSYSEVDIGNNFYCVSCGSALIRQEVADVMGSNGRMLCDLCAKSN
jgi:hypothetical protein